MTDQASPPGHLARVAAWLAAAAIPILLYLPTLQYGFVYDDVPLIVNNTALHDLSYWPTYFARDLDAVWHGTEQVTGNYYRPLALTVMAVVWRLAGAQPAAWHALVAVLHGIVSVLAMAVLRLHGLHLAAACAGAVLFALHPVHVNSVAWVSGIQDVLLGLTALSAYLLYRTWRVRRRAGWLVATLAMFCLALLCKESAVGLWFVVAGEWLWSRRRHAAAGERFSAWAVVLVGGVVLAYLGLRFSVLGALARPAPNAPPLPLALATLPIVLCTYLRWLVWPVGLSLFSPLRPVATTTAPAVLLGALCLAAVTALVAVLVSRRPRRLEACLWVGAWILPCLNIWALNPEWIVMDRYLYLPALAVAWAVVGVDAPRHIPPWRWVGIGLIGATFALLSLRQMPVFRDEATFWAHAVEVDPQSAAAWTEQSRMLSERGETVAARTALQRAAALGSTPPQILADLAAIATRESNFEEAARNYRMILNYAPGYLGAWKNLPAVLVSAGKSQEALTVARAAAERFPTEVDIVSNLGVLLRNLGQRDEALVTLRRARALAPQDAMGALREALVLTELGRIDDAVRVVDEGLALDSPREVRVQLEGVRSGLKSGSPH